MFFVISEEISRCPICGGVLKKRDTRLRIHKVAGGKKEWYVIRRLQCCNENCRRIHNELPDILVPYKHYEAELIEDVVDEVVTEEDIECEDYPCLNTMRNWKRWIEANEEHIDGQVKSTIDRLHDLGTEFVRSMDPILKELRKRISPGWLKAVCRLVYNSGGWLLPTP